MIVLNIEDIERQTGWGLSQSYWDEVAQNWQECGQWHDGIDDVTEWNTDTFDGLMVYLKIVKPAVYDFDKDEDTGELIPCGIVSEAEFFIEKIDCIPEAQNIYDARDPEVIKKENDAEIKSWILEKL